MNICMYVVRVYVYKYLYVCIFMYLCAYVYRYINDIDACRLWSLRKLKILYVTVIKEATSVLSSNLFAVSHSLCSAIILQKYITDGYYTIDQIIETVKEINNGIVTI